MTEQPQQQFERSNVRVEPYLTSVVYLRESRFKVLRLWEYRNIEDLKADAVRKVTDSNQVLDTVKATLNEGIQNHFENLGTLCRAPSADVPNFRDFCGLSDRKTKMCGSSKPSKGTMYTLLNLSVIDAILDACRNDDDLEIVEPPAASESDDVNLPWFKKPPALYRSKAKVPDTLQRLIALLKRVESDGLPGQLSSTAFIEEEGSSVTVTKPDPVIKALSDYMEHHERSATAHKLVSTILNLARMVRVWCKVRCLLID